MQTGSSRDRGRICWYVVDRTRRENETLKAGYASSQVGLFLCTRRPDGQAVPIYNTEVRRGAQMKYVREQNAEEAWR